MKTSIYFLTQAGFITLTLICCGLVIRELKIALPKTSFSKEKQTKIINRTSIALMIWLILISLLAVSGFFQDFVTIPPKLFIVLLVPFITVIIITFSKTLKEILSVIPPQRIIWFQSFRVAVEILLWMLFIQNLIPVQMSFEGRNLDILAGLTAPVIGYFCFVKRRWPKSVAIIWNIVCLGLLANIVTIAILSTPVPFRVFMNEPANTIITIFPFVLLPGLLVPLAYTLHFFSLRQLRGK